MLKRAVYAVPVFLTGMILCLRCGLAFCEEGPESDWFRIKSSYLDIYCERAVDLKLVAKSLERRSLFSSGVYDPNPASAPAEKVAYRLDRILKKVKEILDMYPNIPSLKIKVFEDRRGLNSEYYKIFDREADYKAFYIHQYETIYISEEDITDSVISHEMGHAVVDHYFSVIPPEKIRELLASYVDLHLED
jgi:hypothetical protein